MAKDRFKLLVEKEMAMPGRTWTETINKAAKLLRAQHRHTLRLIRKVQGWQAEQLADNEDALEILYQQLNARAR